MKVGILASLVAGATMIGGVATAQTAPTAKTPTGPFGGDIIPSCLNTDTRPESRSD